nr:PilC/PilY family type IV pilus protein [Marinifaba aquimaris]
MNSRPLVVNYGAPQSNGSAPTDSQQDKRIFLASNSGFLHSFQDKSEVLAEKWAYIPQELLKNLSDLRTDSVVADKVWGLDSSPVAFTRDANGNGQIQKNDYQNVTFFGQQKKIYDAAYIFFGMRRGGQHYYAVNVTDPNAPSLMWKIGPDTAGFENLAYTWSEPVVTTINSSYDGRDPYDPVVIFAAGHDDDNEGNNKGCGLYIVDAKTGSLVYKFDTCGNLASELVGEFPAGVGTLDSDQDGFTDRIYATNKDGIVYRFDLPNRTNTASFNGWNYHKFAEIGKPSGALGNADARKFYSRPSIVRTEIKMNVGGGSGDPIIMKVPYDGVLLTSGDKADPNGKTVRDKAYFLHDRNTITQDFSSSKPNVLTPGSLRDITADPFANASAGTYFDKGDYGWFYDFSENAENTAEEVMVSNGFLDGEKSLSPARVVGGVAYFTTYIPPSEPVTAQCDIVFGDGRIYALDLNYGTQIYKSRVFTVDQTIPATPVLYASQEEDANGIKSSNLTLIGVADGDGDGTLATKKSSGALKCENGNCEDLGLNIDRIGNTIKE